MEQQFTIFGLVLSNKDIMPQFLTFYTEKLTTYQLTNAMWEFTFPENDSMIGA